MTSNPAIFEKAILGSTDYDEQIAELAEKGMSAREMFEEIAILDVQLACDVLRPVWDEANGADGFVSLEVEPAFAHETEKTVAQARDYWGRVDRPNLMVKIPGTEAGVPAIEETIAAGINVNVTLLFSVESYETIAEAYIRGMERRKEAGRVARRALGGELLRLARGHRGRQAARRSRQGGPARDRGGRERARRLPCASRSCSTGTASRRCATPGRRCSARCGRPPA